MGGIVSNVLDMTKWIKFQLNKGTTESGMEVLTPDEFKVSEIAWVDLLTDLN